MKFILETSCSKTKI